MKILLTALASLLMLLTATFASTNHSSAIDLFNNCGSNSSNGTPAVCTDANSGQTTKTNPILGAIRTVIEILSIIIGVASVIVIIVSGLRMSLANGASDSIASARSSLLYSLIGLAIASLAQVIVKIVLGSVG